MSRHTCYDAPYDERHCPACQDEAYREAIERDPPPDVVIDAEIRRTEPKTTPEIYIPAPWERT